MPRHSLLVLLVLSCLLWLTSRLSSDIQTARTPFVENYSLSVLLPLISSSLTGLDDLLVPLLVPTATIREIAIVCPHSLVPDIHRTLPTILSNVGPGHPKISLHPSSGLMHHHQASLLQVIPQVKTQYILLLDEHGFTQISECDRAYLVRPRAVHMPVGPRGFTGSSLNWTQLRPSDHVQPAAFLVPPFVVPSHLLAEAIHNLHSLDWPSFGNYIAVTTRSSFGGIVIGTDIIDTTVCDLGAEWTVAASSEESVYNPSSRWISNLSSISPKGFVVVAFPHQEDLINFIPAACRLCHQGYTVFAYIYDSGPPDAAIECHCTIPYFGRPSGTTSFFDWLNSFASVPDILIGLDHRDIVSSTFALILEQPSFVNTTLIRLPRLQLPYTEWIGTLTLYELRRSFIFSCKQSLHCIGNTGWNVPEVTLSVITNNRTNSLQRLLSSIQRTLFYGDRVNIRINMDQTSDPETMHVVRDFKWSHGDVFLHHRVIHGGLLPAVVESWYPHCDDCHGLLLEDDVELSPLSYAWVKMALLRYKYGSSNMSSQLFGISLYQQKIIELRPTGRQPFDARTLFQSASLADPSTPYLSQIPCSWGALYFASPWREFHDYLSLRLSQFALPIRSVIVPGVRSNKWTKSWKKYFIELVYLRGYVMLYPNYADFVSLSTNHLEVGSHVKGEPEAVYEKKKDLFLLPLMDLSGALAGEAPGPRLLNLPKGTLPDWERLPVLDLLGDLSSLDAIQKRGVERRYELGRCGDIVSLPSSVRDLFCHAPH